MVGQKFLRVALAAVAVQAVVAPWASADPDITPAGNPNAPEVMVSGQEAQYAASQAGAASADPAAAPEGSQVSYEYAWLWSCRDNAPGQANFECASARTCPDPDAVQWMLWARQLTDAQGAAVPGAEWESVTIECHVIPPEVEAAPQPQVTDALVLREVRRLGLPRLTVQVQPADETLVNFETIFYAEPSRWARSVQLVGFDVDVEAAPAGYSWRFGDGAAASTSGPGAPYPAMDVTHTYRDAGVSVAPRVDTAYEVRYRVDGGGWQPIAQTVPAAGLPVDLRIREATAVLVGD